MSALTWYVGDTRQVLATLEPGSVDLVLTSPPFLALRSYLPADHPDKASEIGSEPSPGAFIDTMLDVVEACERVMAPHGSLCFELGDYAGSGGAGGDYAEDGLREGQPAFKGSANRSGWHRMGKRAEQSDQPPNVGAGSDPAREDGVRTVGSLFSGIGGLDLGLERAGWSVAWQVEWDPYCNQVLGRHWPDVVRYGDVTTLDFKELSRVDLLAGGYPCQPFAKCGRMRGEDDPRHLWPHVARAISDLGPRLVLLENVAAHLSLGFGRVLGELASLGYDAEWDCIPAATIGAPHLRDRVFIVAWPRAEQVRSGWDASRDGGTHVADPNGSGRLEQRRTFPAQTQLAIAERCRGWSPEPDVGRVVQERKGAVERVPWGRVVRGPTVRAHPKREGDDPMRDLQEECAAALRASTEDETGCGECNGALRNGICVGCGARPFGFEHRNVGEHRMAYTETSAATGNRCLLCDVRGTDAAVIPPCPSKRERRLVGPWEAVSDEGDAMSDHADDQVAQVLRSIPDAAWDVYVWRPTGHHHGNVDPADRKRLVDAILAIAARSQPTSGLMAALDAERRKRRRCDYCGHFLGNPVEAVNGKWETS